MLVKVSISLFFLNNNAGALLNKFQHLKFTEIAVDSMYVTTKSDNGKSSNSRKSFVVSSFGLVKLKGPIH